MSESQLKTAVVPCLHVIGIIPPTTKVDAANLVGPINLTVIIYLRLSTLMPAMLPRSPRIALVIDRFDGRRGGAALWTRGFASWLAARDCEVHILARSIGPAEALLPIIFHPIEVGPSPLAFALDVSKRLAAIRPLISHDMGAAIGCDVFQPHVGSGLACWNGSVASYPAWLRSMKRLCGYSFRYQRLRRMRAAQYNGRNSVFIAVSHKVARDMQSLHRVPAERIRVVHNGVDLSRFAAATHHDVRRRRPPSIWHPRRRSAPHRGGHNFRLKGIPGLIRAVEQLRRDGNPVKLLLCGGRSKSIDPRDVGHHAVFECGNVEDVVPFYSAADICVHPTFYDACSLVTLEAMAAGLAVITTRANGASELITHGVNGVVLDFPHNARALTAALRPLVRDASIRRALGEAGPTTGEGAQRRKKLSRYCRGL